MTRLHHQAAPWHVSAARRTRGRLGVALLLATLALAAMLTAWVAWSNLSGEADGESTTAAPLTPELTARGAYLARAGNCEACHTARGGAAYAGGRAIETPFGLVFSSNLTPDAVNGIGSWSASDFWRAMHHGRSKSGRLLYPAFPYPDFTHVTRADSDALFAYLRSLGPVAQANREHELHFPYNSQVALAIWRALFFRAHHFEPDTTRSAEWNRGAYLVRGLGHCAACHSSRNAWGASTEGSALRGGLIAVQNWYAPSLVANDEAGVSRWHADDIVALLKTGTSAQGSALGPMAEVVYRSTQHLSEADLRAMASYLQSLPPAAPRKASGKPPDAAALQRGARIYQDHCADCHGAAGQGASGAYPALAGNRSVTMASATNLVRVIVDGGFAPATQGNPRPYGMPPFGALLSRGEVADVASYVRNAWGNQASGVSEVEVLRIR